MIRIGITTYGRSDKFFLPPAYVDAVRSVGALPLLLPPGEQDVAALLHNVDGLILAGGGDIDPTCYQGSGHPTIYLTDLERDKFELALVQHTRERQLPVLGICRGLQVLTVASGGSLVPHVPDVFGEAIAHRHDQDTPTRHQVQLDPDSRLAHMMGTTSAEIASHHHQAAQAVPPGWRAVAHAPDNLIEALEHTDHPWMLAVQWHPELTYTQPHHQRLLRAFVAAAQQHPSPSLS